MGLALLGYMVGVTLIITLVPFRFAIPATVEIMWTGTVVDVVSNVLLFMPLGFLYRLTRGDEVRVHPGQVLALALLFSACIESAQLFEAERYTSPLDIATNGLGGMLGAIIYDRVTRRLAVDAALVGRLSLELPLMGLVYLLLPLLWISGLALGGEPARTWLTLFIALFGASILGALQRHHFGVERGIGLTAMVAAGLGWFLAGAFPALVRQPLPVAGIAVAVVLTIWATGRDSARHTAADRRYEVHALRRAAPFYAAYLCAIPLLALHGGIEPWRVTLGLPGAAGEWRIVDILRLLESLAAFTLLGFMVAELRGRLELPFGMDVRRVLRWSLPIAAIGEVLRGLQPRSSASVAALVLSVGAAIYGAGLYHLQRGYVRSLLGSR